MRKINYFTDFLRARNATPNAPASVANKATTGVLSPVVVLVDEPVVSVFAVVSVFVVFVLLDESFLLEDFIFRICNVVLVILLYEVVIKNLIVLSGQESITDYVTK